ncbi:riboflavin synthase domain-like protein [Gautieria morchelliformis]|nr:riboflavin synthase domain-like protein [Gautieria morchelliformis]
MVSFPSTSTEIARPLLILYATETGNAYDVAQTVAREAKRRHFLVTLTSVDEYPVADLVTEPVIIFVVSTTGSGVEPRSMTPMWNLLLRSDLPSDLLEGMEYAVFGLGDTAYEKFCWAAKKLARRLESLGGREICPRGEGDEQHFLGIEGALDPWIERLFESLLALFPLPQGLEILPAHHLRPSRITMTPCRDITDTQHTAPQTPNMPPFATLKLNRRITSQDWYQDVRHLEFELDTPVEYQPGDVAVIYPEAPEEDVDQFLIQMGWANDADELLKLCVRPGEQPLPANVPPVLTLREAFTRYLDINCVPRRSFFDLLRHFATEDLERDKLHEFCTSEGQEDLYDYCQRVRRTIREVISEFRSLRVPKEYIFDLFPPLRPRQFSIASSEKAHQRQVHLCVAIVQYRTKLRIPRRGVCTMYLSSLAEGSRIPLKIEEGLIRLPPDPATPIICVGPGTGIAPMRAMIEERVHDGAANNTLYFGCRSSAKDQHYGTEWERRVREGTLRYRVSCSRDGAEGTPKVYVQHLIEEDAKLVWEILDRRRGWMYISGSSNKMPVAVKKAIEHAAVSVGGMTEEDAKGFVTRLEREGRLFEECWS